MNMNLCNEIEWGRGDSYRGDISCHISWTDDGYSDSGTQWIIL